MKPSKQNNAPARSPTPPTRPQSPIQTNLNKADQRKDINKLK